MKYVYKTSFREEYSTRTLRNVLKSEFVTGLNRYGIYNELFKLINTDEWSGPSGWSRYNPESTNPPLMYHLVHTHKLVDVDPMPALQYVRFRINLKGRYVFHLMRLAEAWERKRRLMKKEGADFRKIRKVRLTVIM